MNLAEFKASSKRLNREDFNRFLEENYPGFEENDGAAPVVGGLIFAKDFYLSIFMEDEIEFFFADCGNDGIVTDCFDKACEFLFEFAKDEL